MHSVETWPDPLGLNMLDQSTKKMDVTYITKRCLTPLIPFDYNIERKAGPR